FHEYSVCRPMPDAGPRLVRPTQDETKVPSFNAKHVIQRAMEEALSSEPVVPKTESFNPNLASIVHLLTKCLRASQIIKTESSRNFWLGVPREERAGTGYVMPFRKALAPELVVLGNWMKLAEIVGDNCELFFHLPLMKLSPNARSSGVKKRNQPITTETVNPIVDSVNLNSRVMLSMLMANAAKMIPMLARRVLARGILCSSLSTAPNRRT